MADNNQGTVSNGGSVTTDGRGGIQVKNGSVEAAAGSIGGDTDLGKMTPAELDKYYRENFEKPFDGQGVQDELDRGAPTGEPEIDKANEDAQKAKEAEEAAKKAEEDKATKDADKDAKEAKKAEDPKAADLTDDQIREQLKAAGGVYADPRYEPFAIEVTRTGGLTEESVAKAAEAFGVDPAFVRQFVKGQLAEQKLAQHEATSAATAKQHEMGAAILQVVPKAEDYEAMMKWASGSQDISADTKAAYDAAMDRHDLPTVRVLLKDIHEKYLLSDAAPGRREITAKGNGTNPDPKAGQAQAEEAQPFTDRGEYERAVSSRRYREDETFRNHVDARYLKSNL